MYAQAEGTNIENHIKQTELELLVRRVQEIIKDIGCCGKQHKSPPLDKILQTMMAETGIISFTHGPAP